jgi:uncharacterized protein
VEKEMKGKDGSHDYFHVKRVVKNALKIAVREKVVDMELIILAALLHDVRDWKYYKNQFHQNFDFVRLFLHKYLMKPTDRERIEHIIHIIRNIGFSTEIDDKSDSKTSMSLEFKIVQDADRLDAIGAIGVARCFTYGGVTKNSLYDPDFPPINENLTVEDYKNPKGGTINHFHDKLFKLKDMMKTETGKQMAIKRHNFMKVFESQFFDEINEI